MKNTVQKLNKQLSETTKRTSLDQSQQGQAELTMRLIESIEKLIASNKNYSDRILSLTMLLFILALFQLITAIISIPESIKSKWLLAIIVIVSIFYFIDVATRKYGKPKNK